MTFDEAKHYAAIGLGVVLFVLYSLWQAQIIFPDPPGTRTYTNPACEQGARGAPYDTTNC